MSFDAPETTEAHEQRITRCKSCQAQIVWLKTQQGRNIPVDVDTVEPADQIFDRDKHKTHFETCPNADKHRKPSEEKLELMRLRCTLARAGIAIDEVRASVVWVLGTGDWERVLRENAAGRTAAYPRGSLK